MVSAMWWRNKKKHDEPQQKDFVPPVAGTLNPPKKKTFDRAEYEQTEHIFTEQEIKNHIPQPHLRAVNPQTFQLLTASELVSMRKRKLQPHVFTNPMQQLDYTIYESLLKHTFIGALADTFVKFLVGGGFKPQLELINPDVDPEKNAKEIDANQDIIDDLLAIDAGVDMHEPDVLDTTFSQKITSLVMSTLMYNRGALIFNYDRPIKIRDKTYRTIPSNLIYAPAQDLGMIEINNDTRQLKGVQWKHDMYGFVPVSQMIYMWNPTMASKIHNSQFYGTSILSPLIPPSKILRQLLSEDFPAMAKTSWAGLYLLVIKNDGNTVESKEKEYREITEKLTPGKPGVLVKDPEDVNSFDVNFDPKIEEFRKLLETTIKLCISVMGLPQVGFFDEAAANRSTMVGKIQLTMRTTIEPMRMWIGEAIIDQWYGRWFKMLYGDRPEFEKFRIKLGWTDLHIAEWYDGIEAILNLDGRHKLKDNAFGKLVDIDNYEGMLDPEAETYPGGSAGQGLTVEQQGQMPNENDPNNPNKPGTPQKGSKSKGELKRKKYAKSGNMYDHKRKGGDLGIS